MDKVTKYLNQAKSIASGSPCSRRKFGAIIVKDDRVVGTGYNGSARGCLNCGIDIPCIKDIAKEPSNLSYDYCPAVHAEQNAIINSNPADRVGATMYLAPFEDGTGDRPCFKCRRFILNAQIKTVVYVDKDGDIVADEVCPLYEEMENDWEMAKLNEANPDWLETYMDVYEPDEEEIV